MKLAANAPQAGQEEEEIGMSDDFTIKYNVDTCHLIAISVLTGALTTVDKVTTMYIQEYKRQALEPLQVGSIQTRTDPV